MDLCKYSKGGPSHQIYECSDQLPGESHDLIYCTPSQFHLLFMACIASLVAPFVASGFNSVTVIQDTAGVVLNLWLMTVF
jgi:hypothetical protein